MTRRLTTLLILLAVLATSCGTGSSGETGTNAAPGGLETTEASSETDGEGRSNPAQTGGGESSQGTTEGIESTTEGNADPGEPAMAASSPIGAFFADGGGFDAALAEYTVRVEEKIVVCMAEQGFEFVRTTQTVDPIDDLQSELTEREWTNRFGFGISTSFDSIALNQATDPNADILFSLSAAEREIWLITLTGDDSLGGIGDFGARPLEDQGCIGQALIETGGQEAIEGLDTFGSAYEEGEQALFDRREMVEAVDAWARCMGEVGFPGFSELDDPERSIGERLDEVIAPMSAALEALSPEEGQALVAGESFDIADLPDLDLEALRALQADEITLAIADLDCYDAEVRATHEPLRDEFERGLLTEYAAEFDALKNIGS